MGLKKYIVFAFAVFLIAGIFASYSIGTPKHSINEAYSKGASIQGPINISFTNESADSLFSDTRGNSIKLIDLLKTDSRHNYTCYPADCKSYYSSSNGQQTKTISFASQNETIVGFKLNTDLNSITSVSFNATGNAVANCNNQLKIDLFNDGVIDFGNTHAEALDTCGAQNYGCFNSSSPLQEYNLNNRFCQKIKLPEAPGFKLGAYVNKISGSLNLSMELFDKEGTGLGAEGAMCYLPNPIGGGGEISCSVNYLVTKEDDYYACIYPQGTGDYKIKGYSDSNGCGFYGNPAPDTMPYALQIFVIPKKFSPVSTLKITNSQASGDELSFLFEEYITNNYGSLDCAGKNCIVPMKIISSPNQQVVLTDLKLSYEEAAGPSTEEKNFYDVAETPALITAPKQNIYLDRGNFSVPDSTGPYYFKLDFRGTQLFSQRVEVKQGVSVLSLSPLKTARAYPTQFSARVSGNATEYEWDFGDNTTKTTTATSEATHTYTSVGNYTLLLKLKDSQGIVSSGIFQIEVGSTSVVLNDIINQTRNDLNKITSNLSGYDSFSANAIKSILDKDSIEQKLTGIEASYNLIKTNGTETEFENLLTQVISISIPKYIFLSLTSEPFEFYPDKGNINLDVLASIADGDYGDQEDEYKDAILAWNMENMETKVSVKEFSANYGTQDELLVKTFAVEINEINAGETSYLIIEEMTGLQFEDNSSFSQESGYYYKELSGDETIKFLTTEDIDFEFLPMFLSPALSALEVKDKPTPPTPNEFNWKLLGIVLGGIVLLGILAGLLLRRWYKNKYESHLFPNKNDLYNIVNYIQNAKQQGKQEKEIIEDLKKAKWSGEQINYVMRKYRKKVK